MKLEQAVKLRASEVLQGLRDEAVDDLRHEAVEGLVYLRAQGLLQAVRAEAAEAEVEIEGAGAAILSAEAVEVEKRRGFEEAREHYGEPPRAETDAAMNEALQELRAVQGQLEAHRRRASRGKVRLSELRELEAVLAEVREPELEALRELAAML